MTHFKSRKASICLFLLCIQANWQNYALSTSDRLLLRRVFCDWERIVQREKFKMGIQGGGEN